MSKPPLLKLTKHTLLIIPCSKRKTDGRNRLNGISFLSELDRTRASQLKAARDALREKANVDESTRMPAYRRYSGYLYEVAGESIGTAVTAGYHVLIVSGGYGLVLANEPVGKYDKKFVRTDWPSGLLEECLLRYGRRASIRSVIAVMSRTTDYAELVRRVPWKNANLDAKLVFPVCPGGSGASRQVPFAQGKAIADLISKGLNPERWRSKELTLKVEDLGCSHVAHM